MVAGATQVRVPCLLGVVDNSLSIRRKIPLISDWTIIVVALIAAAAYLTPRMSTFVVNLRQLKKMEQAAELPSWQQEWPPKDESESTSGYV